MHSSKPRSWFVHPSWAAPVARFGLLLSLACLASAGCDSANNEGDGGESSEKDTGDKSNEKDPEQSDEPSEGQGSDETDGSEGDSDGSEKGSQDSGESDQESDEPDDESDEPDETDGESDQPSEEPDEESDEPDDEPDEESDEPDNSKDGKRDCEKIKWGKRGIKEGQIVARGDVRGIADSDGDFKPENDEVDAGMCELHLTKYRCAMVLYGAG